MEATNENKILQEAYLGMVAEDKIATLELVLKWNQADLQKMETGILDSSGIPEKKNLIKRLQDRIVLIKSRETL